jgi:hypothetical protein
VRDSFETEFDTKKWTGCRQILWIEKSRTKRDQQKFEKIKVDSVEWSEIEIGKKTKSEPVDFEHLVSGSWGGDNFKKSKTTELAAEGFAAVEHGGDGDW